MIRSIPQKRGLASLGRIGFIGFGLCKPNRAYKSFNESIDRNSTILRQERLKLPEMNVFNQDLNVSLRKKAIPFSGIPVFHPQLS
jgi:hypothetical protein